MKTIKEIAEAVHVSKTSVYNLIKKNNISTFKKNGVTYVDEQGENRIIAYYSSDQQQTLNDILEDSYKAMDEVSIQPETSHKELDILAILEKQLGEKDKTIQALIHVISYDKKLQAAMLLTDNRQETKDTKVETGSPLPASKTLLQRLLNFRWSKAMSHSMDQ